MDSVNKDSSTALIGAARYGHKEVCELLVSRGCNVDLQNKNSDTASVSYTHLTLPTIYSV